MKPRELFKVIVATLGVIGILYGVIDVIDGVLGAMNFYEHRSTGSNYYFARGAIQMFIGALIIKGFPPFVDIAFPPDNEKPDVQTKKDNE